MALASAAEPMSWSGSRADIIANRSAAFSPLEEHEDPRIRSGAQEVMAHLNSMEARERERERLHDEEREQTFE